jgi:mRNA interferase RelE/StbE
MRFEIILTDNALEDLKALPAPLKASIRDALETHLRFEPEKISKSRIKRLRDLKQPEYRLHVDQHRIFYDVLLDEVIVLAIVPKSLTDAYLEKFGVPSKSDEEES